MEQRARPRADRIADLDGVAELGRKVRRQVNLGSIREDDSVEFAEGGEREPAQLALHFGQLPWKDLRGWRLRKSAASR